MASSSGSRSVAAITAPSPFRRAGPPFAAAPAFAAAPPFAAALRAARVFACVATEDVLSQQEEDPERRAWRSLSPLTGWVMNGPAICHCSRAAGRGNYAILL